MPSTFFGLTVASSGLRAFQTALNTSANNVSNVQTKGYTKQVANREAAEAYRVYEKYGTAGSGVTTTSIKSVRNEYYDKKYWVNQSSVGYYDTKVSYLGQIEGYFIDDEDESMPGFVTIFGDLFSAVDSLHNHAEEKDYRQAAITNAQILCNYFNNVSGSLVRLQKDCNEQIKTLVESINASSRKIATLTKQINDIELQGGIANELRDQRALVIDELSEIVPVTVEESPVTNSNYPEMYTGGTNFLVKLDGQTIVDRFEYRTFTCQARENRVSQSDVDGLYDVVWSDTGMKFNLNATTMNGTLKALFEMRDGNNSENFQGRVTKASVSSVTIKPSTQTSVETMTMAQEGRITIGYKVYNYESFTATLDENGNITEYKFELKEHMDDAERQELLSRQAQIGDKVDFMGIPYYMGQMSEFLRNFVERFNAIEMSGQDLNGDPMESFFRASKIGGEEYDFHDQTVSTDGVTDPTKSVISSTSDSYYQLTALNVKVAERSRKDSSLFSTTGDAQLEAAQDIVGELLKLKDKVELFRGDHAEGFLKCILTDLTVDTNEAKIFQENFNDISASINTQRMSVAGVDEDEEALDLVKFQNAYNLASRMIQCMSEIYNKLINETGV